MAQSKAARVLLGGRPGTSATSALPETGEAPEAQSVDEVEAAQLRALLLDDSAPTDPAADYGDAYDAAEVEVEQARRAVAQSAQLAAPGVRLAIRWRSATHIQQAFLTRDALRRRANADPAVEMYLERLERFTLLQKQTKTISEEDEAALEAAGTPCCFCGVPWERKHATANGFRHFGRAEQFTHKYKPLVAKEACPMLARCASDTPSRAHSLPHPCLCSVAFPAAVDVCVLRAR